MVKKAIRKLGGKSPQPLNQTNPALQQDQKNTVLEISIQLEINRRLVQDQVSSVNGLTFYEVETPYGLQLLIVYLAGLVKKDELNRDVINPFIIRTEIAFKERIVDLSMIKKLLLEAPVKETGVFNEVTAAITRGDTTIFIQGIDTAFIISPKEPSGESAGKMGLGAKAERNSAQIQIQNKTGDLIANQSPNSPILPSQVQARKIFPTVEENLAFIKNILSVGMGLITGEYKILGGKVKAGVAYIETVTNQDIIFRQVIEPLLEISLDQQTVPVDLLSQIQTRYISVPDMLQTDRMEQVVEGLLSGDAVLFIDQADRALVIGNRKVASRSIEKPLNEVTVLASLESFTENLKTNCSLVLKRVPTPDLRFEAFTVGKLSHTQVKLLWIEGVADSAIIDEARCRIQNIDIDGLESIGMLAVLIEDQPNSLFAKYKQTERPDVVARYLFAGHFAVLCGNDPFAMIAPVTFWDNFKTMDDYSERYLASSYLRLIRYAGFVISILISPLYLAFVTHNHAIVPPVLALAIANGREGVPFPSVVELLFMTFAISILREAAIRMPGSVSFFIGTLAAVVIGQAAVTAGYVSASLIIVVAASAISVFAISSTTLIYPARLVNYGLILLAGVFGIFGVIKGIILLLWHLVSLKSFGVPYLYPLVPFEGEGWKDTFIRLQYSFLQKRLKLLAPTNRTRIGTKGLDPNCPKRGEDE